MLNVVTSLFGSLLLRKEILDLVSDIIVISYDIIIIQCIQYTVYSYVVYIHVNNRFCCVLATVLVSKLQSTCSDTEVLGT